jgi:hypothetical protein
VLFAVLIAVLALNAVALLGRASLLDDMLAGRMPEAGAVDAADNFVLATVVPYFLLFVAIVVVFIVWQFRHARNARLLGSRRKLGPGWAIGGWFIPLANTVLPAMQMFGASKHSDNDGVGIRYEGGRGAPIVVWWAIVFAIAGVVESAALGMAPDENVYGDLYVSDLAASDRLEAASDLVFIVAAVLAIVMVRTLTARQERALQTAMGAGLLPPNAPAWPGVAHPGGPPMTNQGWAAPPAGLQPPSDQHPPAPR